mmetsp:Transcript_26871/g.47857  ORF Transcript_26871/g.47857 Transcript_26871/m.47857 type:complete len:200 (+) Transcript_26871:148-747(+)
MKGALSSTAGAVSPHDGKNGGEARHSEQDERGEVDVRSTLPTVNRNQHPNECEPVIGALLPRHDPHASRIHSAQQNDGQHLQGVHRHAVSLADHQHAVRQAKAEPGGVASRAGEKEIVLMDGRRTERESPSKAIHAHQRVAKRRVGANQATQAHPQSKEGWSVGGKQVSNLTYPSQLPRHTYGAHEVEFPVVRAGGGQE